MTDEVLVKEADGTRSMRKRDRTSTVSIVHVDFEPFLKKLFEQVKEAGKHKLDDNCIGFKAHSTMGYVPTSKGLYLLDNEACGPDGVEDPITETAHASVPIYNIYEDGSFTMMPLASANIDREILLELPVKGVMNFGKWVRKFGDRLESNFHNWNNHLTPIYDAEYIEKLNK